MSSSVLSPTMPALIVLSLALSAGCQREAEPAPAGARPDLTGRVIGTKPGPAKAASKVDNPFGMQPEVLTEGRRLFVWYNCYGCHGGRAGGGMGPSLRDATWLYGREDQDIFNSISEGRPRGMPAWGTVLPEEQMWKLTAYIRSLGRSMEPRKPPANPVFPNPPPRRDIEGATAGGGPN